jgi:predicted dehydrogenase
MAMFNMGRGIVFTYRGSWCADGFRSSWEAGWRIVGERGSLIWDGFDDLRAEGTTKVRDGLFDDVEPIVVPPLDPTDRVGGHLGVMQDFIAAIKTGSESETAGTDNIKSLAMVLGAIESAETGRRVPITI